MTYQNTTSLSMNPQEFQAMRDLIEKECGIAVQEDKIYLLETRLTKLVYEADCNSFMEFYQKAVSAEGIRFRNKIVDAMTTNETLWFRDEKPFILMRDVIFPELNKKLETGEKKQIRIWSAACSTGQEPYSLAMMAYEAARLGKGRHLIASPDHLSIVGSDISPSVIVLARAARYDNLAISRGMKPDMRDLYFKNTGRVWQVKSHIKEMVTFQQFNLQRSFSLFGKFDVIMLRNVAIYFSREFKTQLFQKMVDALNPGGYFFLGSSESLMGYETPFVQKEFEKCRYYQLNK